MSELLIWTWQVPENSEYSDQRADSSIYRAMKEEIGEWSDKTAAPSLSRSQIKKTIQEKRVTVSNQPIKASTLLGAGDCIRFEMAPLKRLELKPVNLPLEILFEDDSLAVINKPAGISVHPSSSENAPTLVHLLLHHLSNLSGIGGVERPGIVHRIDKFTSGTLVIAKTDLAHQNLSKLFSDHTIDRRYIALCYGSPSESEFRIESKIDRNPKDRKKMSSRVESGRTAISHMKVLKRFCDSSGSPFASLIEAKLETGRTHQVRVHLNDKGFSIMGDPLYGIPTERQTKWTKIPGPVKKLIRDLPGQALHAQYLSFAHPVSSETMRFEAEAPKEFTLLLDALGRYS